jgi:fumarylacetoacetase
MTNLNTTHDSARRSWVESANGPDTDFPIQNLPFGVFRRGGDTARGGVAIGDRIVDLAALAQSGLLSGAAGDAARAASDTTLNALMALGNGPASALRARLSDLLRHDGPDAAKLRDAADRLLVPMTDAAMQLPTAVGGFTDFLCSIFHTRRLSNNNIPPSFKYLPVAYNGRASSVRVSGEALKRPNVQYPGADGAMAVGPEPKLDFELEMGAFVGAGNALGEPIPIAKARDHLFGYCLLNDWSARSVQRWEMPPLGPFRGKSMSTSISPWVVTAEALAPFHGPLFAREEGYPAPLPYLASAEEEREGALDVALDALWLTDAMRQAGHAGARVTATNANVAYWTFAQLVTDHAANGCNLRPGDILGSGTLSGPVDESRACIAELTVNGSAPLSLPGGETRAWLEDGDEIVFHGRASRDGFVSIGFGECRGRIEPAVAWPD